MRGMGTICNVLAVIAGSGIGLWLKSGLSDRFQKILMQACSLAVIFIGASGAMAGLLTVSGGGRRELQNKTISAELEQVLESRQLYQPEPGAAAIPVIAGEDKYTVAVAAPILSEGDVLGGVLFLTETGGRPAGEVEVKLAQTVSMFLGKQMEN